MPSVPAVLSAFKGQWPFQAQHHLAGAVAVSSASRSSDQHRMCSVLLHTQTHPQPATHTVSATGSSCLSEIYIHIYISNISDYVRPPSAAFPKQCSAATSAAPRSGVPSQASGAGMEEGLCCWLSSDSVPLPSLGQRWGAHSTNTRHCRHAHLFATHCPCSSTCKAGSLCLLW